MGVAFGRRARSRRRPRRPVRRAASLWPVDPRHRASGRRARRASAARARAPHEACRARHRRPTGADPNALSQLELAEVELMTPLTDEGTDVLRGSQEHVVVRRHPGMSSLDDIVACQRSLTSGKPAGSRIRGRPNDCPHRPKKISKSFRASGRIRTCDLRLRRPSLYPAELRTRWGTGQSSRRWGRREPGRTSPEARLPLARQSGVPGFLYVGNTIFHSAWPPYRASD